MTLPAPRRPFSTSLILALLVYLLALVGLGGYLFWPRSEQSVLRVTSARLAPEGDRILLEGEGFGPATQVSLSLDVTDRRLLRHSVPTWGRGGEMVRVGNMLYALVQKKGLLILDLGEPLRPQVIGTFVLQEMMRAVVVEDGIAYIACDQAGLVLVDVRNPLSPQRLGSLPELVRAQGMVVRDGRLYAAVTSSDVPSALAVVDVAHPSQPRLVGRVPLPGQPLGLTFWQDRLLVAAGKAGLIEMTLGGELPQVKSRLDLPGTASSLIVVEGQAYVACATGGVVLVDMTGGQPRLSPHPAFAFKAIRMVHEAGRVYLAADRGQGLVLDIQRPDQPQLLGEFFVSGTRGMTALDRTVYFNTASSGVQVLDLVALPNPVGPRPRIGEETAHSVTLENNLVVMSTYAGSLHLLELGGGREVHWLASFAMKAPSPYLHIHSGLVYARLDHVGLEVVDIRDPKNPVGAGYFPVEWQKDDRNKDTGSVAFSLRGDLGALVDRRGELILFDPAEPSRLQLRPGPKLPEPIEKLTWGEDFLYATSRDGTKIIPIAMNLSEAATVYPAYSLPTKVIKGFALIGKVMVIACGLEGLLTVDFSDPAAPRLLAVQPLAIDADFLHLVGTTAYLADARGGFIQLDLSDPAHPRDSGLRMETADLQGFTIADTHAFLAAGSEGLQIVPLPQALQPLSRSARQLSLALPPIDTSGHYTLRVTDGGQSLALPGVLKLGGRPLPLAQQAQRGGQ